MTNDGKTHDGMVNDGKTHGTNAFRTGQEDGVRGKGNQRGDSKNGNGKSGWNDGKGGWNASWGNVGKIRGRNGGFPSGGHRGGVPFKATGHKGGISRQG